MTQTDDFSKIMAEVSGTMISIIVMLRIALYNNFSSVMSKLSNPLLISLICITVTLFFSLGNIKIFPIKSRVVINIVAFISLILGTGILIAIMSIN